MDPFTIMLIGGAIAAAIAAATTKRKPQVAEPVVKLEPQVAKAVEEKEVVQAMAEPVAKAATEVAAKTGEKVAAKAEATGAPPNIVKNLIKGAVVIGATIALLKGLSARRAREDLKYARKQWVKDIVFAINRLAAEELKGKSDLDVFRFLVDFHPPLYPGPPKEAAAQNIASGGTAYLEHTGWNLRQTLYDRRKELSAWPT